MKKLLFPLFGLLLLAACEKEEVLPLTKTDLPTETLHIRSNNLPVGWTHTDIGAANGTADINTCAETTSLSASGFSLPNSDVLHYAYVEKCGDFTMVAKINNIQNPGWAGMMIREDQSPDARKIAIKTNLGNFIRRDARTTPDGAAQSSPLFRLNATWFKLVREGNNFSGYSSPNGVNWQFAMAVDLALPNCVEAGLFVEGINTNTTTTAGFVQVDLALPEVCDGFDNDCDGQVDEDCLPYATVILNGQTWLAENLDIDIPGSSWCYDNDPANCVTYGRLYTWEAAKDGCAQLGDGWRLPSESDWIGLINTYGGIETASAYDDLILGGSSGFDALLAGSRYPYGSYTGFYILGDDGIFWSATEHNDHSAWVYDFRRDDVDQLYLYQHGYEKPFGFSCRCVKD